MTKTLMQIDQSLVDAIRVSWSRDTSYEPDRWSAGNPAWGQCAVTALVVQDYLGGSLLRATDGAGITHFWGQIDGQTVDLTAEQFAAPPVWIAVPEHVDRDSVLAWPDTRRRYDELKVCVARSLDLG
jgi:hypothetical protein